MRSDLSSFNPHEHAQRNLKQLVQYANALNVKYGDLGFAIYAKNLDSILIAVNKKANHFDLSEGQLQQIAAFTRKLSNDKPFIQRYFHNTGFVARLHQFWNLYQTVIQPPGDILQIIPFELNERIPQVKKEKKVDASIHKASKALITSSNIAASLLENPNGISAITNVLTALESRVEGHERLMRDMLREAKKVVGLNYDIEEMCSIQHKVEKGTEWRSDVRAIRDAFSHNHYIIRKTNGDYEVTFDNNEGGYNYQKHFSSREFILFYQDYDRIMVIYDTLFRAGLIYKLVALQKQLDSYLMFKTQNQPS